MRREVSIHRFAESRKEGLFAKSREESEAPQLVLDPILHLCKAQFDAGTPAKQVIAFSATSTNQFNDLAEASKTTSSSWCTPISKNTCFGPCAMASRAARLASVRMRL